MKYILPILTTLVLSACGGSSSGTNDIDDAMDGTSQTVSGIGSNITINNPNDTELDVSGINNTITIETPLSSLTVSGSSNMLIFVTPALAPDCTISGLNNSSVDNNGVFTSLGCNNTGSGNEGF